MSEIDSNRLESAKHALMLLARATISGLYMFKSGFDLWKAAEAVRKAHESLSKYDECRFDQITDKADSLPDLLGVDDRLDESKNDLEEKEGHDESREQLLDAIVLVEATRINCLKIASCNSLFCLMENLVLRHLFDPSGILLLLILLIGTSQNQPKLLAEFHDHVIGNAIIKAERILGTQSSLVLGLFIRQILRLLNQTFQALLPYIDKTDLKTISVELGEVDNLTSREIRRREQQQVHRAVLDREQKFFYARLSRLSSVF